MAEVRVPPVTPGSEPDLAEAQRMIDGYLDALVVVAARIPADIPYGAVLLAFAEHLLALGRDTGDEWSAEGLASMLAAALLRLAGRRADG